MGIQKAIDTADLIYFVYSRESWDDVKKLKRELDNCTSAACAADVVVQFMTNSCVSPEIGAIAGFLNAIQGKPRALRLVVSPEVQKQICTTNLQTIEQLRIYGSKEELIRELKP